MATPGDSLKLTAAELDQTFSDPNRYPPIMTIEEVAGLLKIPKATIYDWKSRGLLKGCCRKIGKHLRFFRDRLIVQIFNEGLDGQ